MRAARGATTVEFAVVGLMFFVLLIGVIEIGRLLYTWNTLEEAARRGARVAAVCPPNHGAIARVAVFNGAGGPAVSPVVHGLTTANVAVDYLDKGGAVVSPTVSYMSIKSVRVRIVNFQYDMLIPAVGKSFTFPQFPTVLPRESLGVSPGAVQCFGTAS